MKPYLIIPRLIEQPTWGGTYIAELKNWSDLPQLRDKKIGQSYELTGDSTLATDITDSTHRDFRPEFEHPSILGGTISLTQFIESDPSHILGEKVHQQIGQMPLLIKLNQAAGNSFQLHVTPCSQDQRCKSKIETW